MSVYKSFAVVGGGAIGLPIVNALAAKNVAVILLSRPGSAQKTVPSGVQIVQVDLTDAAAVAAVFKEHRVDVVLSTVTTTATAAQKSLVDAAKLAAIKLFLPSEYGFVTEGHAEGLLAAKDHIAAHLKSAGIPSTRIYTGLFIEYIPWLVDYSSGSKIKVIGKGEAPLSVTSVADIAGFVAHVLTTVPPSELENRSLRLEGERTSLNDLAVQLKTSVERVDSIGGEGGEFKTALQLNIGSGGGSTGWNVVNKVEGTGSNAAGSGNALWPGHQWQSIKEVLKL
ncbi:hypothetical protein DFH08DRAFT_858788 [Mycena albidolilacea]|uniref:NmrA-like domain-containing protein n=1 Tax=Mycena albidolilacea TaxID=1033008 RepID=A0AAD7A8Z7_9AGAR|nr:hypothetical protein DFH08DRAFT_858788 [Mycena albidolilacea]